MTKPYQRLRATFLEEWHPELEDNDVGSMLRELSQELGRVAAQLNGRGVPWNVVERNIKEWMARGVAVETALAEALLEEAHCGEEETTDDEGDDAEPGAG